MNSSVMYARFRSHVARVFHWKSFFVITGRFSATSHVLFCSVPAFCHLLAKPSEDGVGTLRIWLRVSDCAYVTSTPRRPKSVRSVPNSFSVVVSGLSCELPACPSEQPLAEQL